MGLRLNGRFLACGRSYVGKLAFARRPAHSPRHVNFHARAIERSPASDEQISPSYEVGLPTPLLRTERKSEGVAECLTRPECVCLALRGSPETVSPSIGIRTYRPDTYCKTSTPTSSGAQFAHHGIIVTLLQKLPRPRHHPHGSAEWIPNVNRDQHAERVAGNRSHARRYSSSDFEHGNRVGWRARTSDREGGADQHKCGGSHAGTSLEAD